MPVSSVFSCLAVIRTPSQAVSSSFFHLHTESVGEIQFLHVTFAKMLSFMVQV